MGVPDRAKRAYGAYWGVLCAPSPRSQQPADLQTFWKSHFVVCGARAGLGPRCDLFPRREISYKA